MSQAKPRKSAAARPPGGWRFLRPSTLALWPRLRSYLEPLGLTTEAQFRRSRSGVAVRWERAGVRIRYEISTEQVDLATKRHAEAVQGIPLEGALPWAQMCLALLVAERLALRVPRGATAQGAEWTPTLRACAQEVYERIQLEELLESPRPWFSELRRRAEGVGPSAVEMTAYAMVAFSDIEWEKLGLKSPTDEVEYFKKHYLDGDVVTNREGRGLAKGIVDKCLTLAKAASPVPVRLKRLLERRKERFYQIGASLSQ